jgi:hypothetical protein
MEKLNLMFFGTVRFRNAEMWPRKAGLGAFVAHSILRQSEIRTRKSGKDLFDME